KTAVGDKTNVVLGAVFAAIVLVARRGIVGEILHASMRRAPLREQAEPVHAAGTAEAS
ncbi:MAG: hypothetical protein JOY59_08160, partial [Candidatus Eremiobacteraeota bacterium]|nr:hypothetical protein [Candidatus Eremiobacteraeota bacterium]